MSLKFEVNENVLIPRWDTERMVELVLEKLEDYEQPLVVDVGTGSGAIIVSLAKFFPRGKFFGLDISRPALEVAVRNARRHGVADKITFIEGDLLAPFLSSPKYNLLARRQLSAVLRNFRKASLILSYPIRHISLKGKLMICPVMLGGNPHWL